MFQNLLGMKNPSRFLLALCLCFSAVFANAQFLCNATLNTQGSGTTYTFQASTNAPNPGAVIGWIDFGDGSSVSGFSAAHTYTYNGLYNACFTMIDSTNNCVFTTCDSVLVTGGSNAGTNCGVTVSTAHVNGMVAFTASPSGVAPFTYSWANAVPGTASNGSTAYMNAPQQGVVVNCVTVTDATGCTVSTCAADTLGFNSPCGVYVTTARVNGLVEFTALPSGVGPFTYSWFSSTLGTPTNASVAYANAIPNGVVFNCVTVTDATGCTASTCATDTFGVGPSCYANIYYSVTPTGAVDFFASGNYGANAQITWSFGDGTSGVDSIVTHTYAQNGTYTVTMTLTDGSCQFTSSVIVVVGTPSCDATFYIFPDSLMNGTYYAWSLASTTNIPYAYLWDFGDGSTSTAVFPSHVYAQPGTYTICLTVTDTLTQCTNTYCDSSFYTPRGLTGNPMSQLSVVPQPSTTATTNVLDDASFHVVPNPTMGEVRLSLDGATLEVVRVMDIVGHIQMVQNANATNLSLDLSALPAGMYLISVQTTDGQTGIKRILKQ